VDKTTLGAPAEAANRVIDPNRKAKYPRKNVHARPSVPDNSTITVETNREAAATDVRLGRIVRLLGDHAMLVVSGTKIADEIGTSRSEVWRLIEQLRKLGVQIAGHPATGYQLEQAPDLLLPEFLRPSIKGTIFADLVRHYFRIGSTNLVAMEAASGGAPEGTVFLAEEQTAGRGRGGHSWHSVRSRGIYCSAILRPQLPPADALMLSLLVGLAVRAAVAEVTGITADLRWPNDLLLNRRKFCGILIEMNAEVTRVRYAVAGIGMNINHTDFPVELRSVATSLLIETGQSWSRMELAATLLKSLDREYRLLGDAAARKDLVPRFEAASSMVRGCRVHVEEEGGYDGVTEGLDDRGFLRVRTDSRMRTVLSGGVRAI
jgi:BirA family biotin operon repressor/biotin-[acetyl-CoA-carboxylase] ligase